MKKEVADKLVAALRSGEYKQTTKVLRDDMGYCCLGVLCDLAIKEDITPGWVQRTNAYGDVSYQTNGVGGVLPIAVRKWADMDSDNGTFDDVDEFEEPMRNALSMLNDEGKSFNEIADFIEGNYATL